MGKMKGRIDNFLNKRLLRAESWRVTLLYAVLTSTGIVLSDSILTFYVPNPQQHFRIEITGGLMFVVLTSILLKLLLNRWYGVQQTLDQSITDAYTALHLSEERWKFALEGAGNGVWDRNVQTNEAYYSTRYKEMLGFTESDAWKTSNEWSDRVHPEDFPSVMAAIQDHLSGKTSSIVHDYRMRCKDGNWKWIHGRGKIIDRDPEGKPLRLVGTIVDISERMHMIHELEHQARYDYLTGLANRRYFHELAEVELARAQRYGSLLTLLMMDIDFFKNINDTYGHKVGDLVLQHLALVCNEALREIDLIGRVGGEEFAILLPETAGLSALEVAERMRQEIQNTGVLINEQNDHIKFTVSIGVAMMLNENGTVDKMLQDADAALYQAKETGRNKVIVFSSGTSVSEK